MTKLHFAIVLLSISLIFVSIIAENIKAENQSLRETISFQAEAIIDQEPKCLEMELIVYPAFEGAASVSPVHYLCGIGMKYSNIPMGEMWEKAKIESNQEEEMH